jgi:hypothetical protein
MKHLYIDGTFSLAPQHFYQIYVVMAKYIFCIKPIHLITFRRDNWVFPVAYALLSNKSQRTYERMWNLLVQAWPTLQPESISTDFEMGAINAVNNVFPDVDIHGCLFHLVRNMKKHLESLHLMTVLITKISTTNS